MDTIIWAIIFVMMVIAELATMQLISIWFAVGALGAAIAAFFDLGFWWQFVIFTVVSVLLLIFTAPLLRKVSSQKAVATNVDINIGKTAIVIIDINNALGTGRATLSGVDWNAVSENGSVIPAGSVVEVKAIDGAKLIVAPTTGIFS